jgi:hypothetical protein
VILKISNREILESSRVTRISDFKLRKKCLILLECIGKIFKIKIIEDPKIEKGRAVLLQDDGTFITELNDKEKSK